MDAMAHETMIDLAGYAPTDFAERAEPWPTAPQRMGACVTRSGLQGFASRSDYPEPVRLSVCDSAPRLHLSVWLRDGVEVCTDGWNGLVKGRDSVAGFLPGVPWRTRFHGASHHVGLLLPPEVLTALAGAEGEAFFAGLRRGAGLRVTPGDDAMLGAAHALETLLLSDDPHPLLCEAKCLELLAAFLTIGRARPATGLSRPERDRLHHARDRLLGDLADPPTIAELARVCGLNTLKLKQGFKALFGLPVHAFYQQERMRAARRMLAEEGLSVTETGSRLGYSNLSHFSAAFKRSHGILPGAVKRERR